MQNLWSDGDAKSAIAHHAAKGIGEDLGLGASNTTRLLGGEPRLVLHGGGNTSVKTSMADVTGEPVEVLCVKRQAAGTWARSRRPACPRCALAPLGSLLGLQALLRRGHGQRPALQPPGQQGAEPVGRDSAARLPAAQVHRSHAFQRGGWHSPTSPTARKLARATCSARARRWCPTSCRAFALARERPARWSRANPDVEGLVLLKHGHLLDGRHGRRGLCPHDRSGDLGGEASRQGPRARSSPASACPRRWRRRPRVAPILARAPVVAGESLAAARPRSASCSNSAAGRRSWPMSPARRSTVIASRDR